MGAMRAYRGLSMLAWCVPLLCSLSFPGMARFWCLCRSSIEGERRHDGPFSVSPPTSPVIQLLSQYFEIFRCIVQLCSCLVFCRIFKESLLYPLAAPSLPWGRRGLLRLRCAVSLFPNWVIIGITRWPGPIGSSYRFPVFDTSRIWNEGRESKTNI